MIELTGKESTHDLIRIVHNLDSECERMIDIIETQARHIDSMAVELRALREGKPGDLPLFEQ